MRRLAYAAALILPFAQGPAQALILTGENGGTIEKTRDCTRAEGTAICEVGTLYTAPDGQTAMKLRLRTTVPGSSTTTITLTGPNGETRTRERTITRGN